MYPGKNRMNVVDDKEYGSDFSSECQAHSVFPLDALFHPHKAGIRSR